MSVLERALRKASKSAKDRNGELGPGAGSALVPMQTRAPSRRASPAVAVDLGAVHEVTQQMLVDSGFVVEEHAERLRTEFRRIKRPLLATAFGDGSLSAGPARFAMVTSAVPGDGKSFVAMNLALSIARERERSVVLIDADVPRKTLTEALGLGAAPGLTDLVTVDGTSLSDVLRPTSIDGLTVLPAGRQDRDAPELLSSAHMRSAMEELESAFPNQIVIFDTPPLLASSEALAVSEYVGQILLVVRAGVTGQRSVQQALDMLDRSKAINLVLNGASSMLGDNYYSYADYYHSRADSGG